MAPHVGAFSFRLVVVWVITRSLASEVRLRASASGEFGTLSVVETELHRVMLLDDVILGENCLPTPCSLIEELCRALHIQLHRRRC